MVFGADQNFTVLFTLNHVIITLHSSLFYLVNEMSIFGTS